MNKREIFIISVLALAFSFFVWDLQGHFPTLVFEKNIYNFWFEADMTRVFEVMTWRQSEFQKTTITHPLYALLTYPTIVIIKKLLGVDPLTAVKLFTCGVSFVWVIGVYGFLRVIGCAILDSAVYTLLAISSSASIFFFAVPETFQAGSLMFLISLAFAKISERKELKVVWYIVLNMATLSITTANWMAGIIVTAINHHWKRTFQICVYAFFFVTMLWSVEKVLFPAAKYFGDITREMVFIGMKDTGGPTAILRSFFYHTMIAPEFYPLNKYNNPGWPIIFTQLSPVGSKMLGSIWTVLLGVGFWSLTQIRGKFKIAFVLLLSGQILITLFYGNETFLYSLHFIVLLVPLIAISSLTKLRYLSLTLAIIFIPLVFTHNLSKFKEGAAFVLTCGTEEQKEEMNGYFSRK